MSSEDITAIIERLARIEEQNKTLFENQRAARAQYESLAAKFDDLRALMYKVGIAIVATSGGGLAAAKLIFGG